MPFIVERGRVVRVGATEKAIAVFARAAAFLPTQIPAESFEIPSSRGNALVVEATACGKGERQRYGGAYFGKGSNSA